MKNIKIPAAIEERYETWSRFLDENLHFRLKSVIHTKDHEKRVLLFSLMIGERLGLSEEELDILGAASVFHDTRRQEDWLDTGHGDRAAAYYKEYCEEKNFPYHPEVFAIMAFHDRDDRRGNEFIRKNFKDWQRVLLLYHIFKDADGLDRFRLGENGLDERYLRTKEGRGLVPLAKKLSGKAVSR